MIKIHLSRILGERRIKMADLARETGLAKNTILNLYHERGQGVTWDVLEHICIALNIQPGELLEWVPEEEEEGECEDQS